MFLDSTGGCDEFNLRIFVMVTHSPAGALPLGIFITSDEQTDTLVQALALFTACLPGKFTYFGSAPSYQFFISVPHYFPALLRKYLVS